MNLPFKLSRPLIAYDLETHDLVEPRIIEMGFRVFYPDGRPSVEWSKLIDPETPIAPAATAKHGITNEQIASCQKCGGARHAHDPEHEFAPAPLFRQVATRLASGLSDCDFVGYNIKFDLQTTAAEMERANVKWTYANARIIDAHRLWQQLEPRSLSDAASRFLKREPTSAHRALGDADDALEIALAILAEGTAKRGWSFSDVQSIHRFCFPQDANKVDADGRFVWKGNSVAIAFGKHSGTLIQHVPPSYLRWICDGRFPDDVKRLCVDALAGKFPTRSVASQETV